MKTTDFDLICQILNAAHRYEAAVEDQRNDAAHVSTCEAEYFLELQTLSAECTNHKDPT